MDHIGDLVTRFLTNNDPECKRLLLEQIWTLCLDRVESLAYRHTRNQRHLLEDYIQEGYLKFVQLLGSYNPAKNVPFPAYLTGCLTNYFIDLGRKKKERPVDVSRSQYDREVKTDFSTLDVEELSEHIDETLKTVLPGQKQRERKILAFKMRRLQGRGVAEIAQFLGVKRANTVSVWIYEVNAAFAEAFARRHPDYVEEVRETMLVG